MRFGLFVPQGWRHDLVGIEPAEQWGVMKGLAQHADAGPWESIWVYDHFHTVPAPTDEATHEAWSLMAAFGAVTERVRLGQMCTCMSYRNPAYLAKVAATCDIVSGGRVEMGIGAGWYEHEWRAYGYGFPPPPERLGMLDEGVQIMRQAWTEGVGDLQREALPGRRRPRLRRCRCRRAASRCGSPAAARRSRSRSPRSTRSTPTSTARWTASPASPSCCASTAASVGTDFDAIVRSANYNVAIGRDEAEVQERMQAAKARLVPYVGEEKAEGSLGAVRGMPACGTPEQIVENLRALEKAGMSYGIFNFAEAAYDRSGIELFEREVDPRARLGRRSGGFPMAAAAGCGSMASCASPSSEPVPPASSSRSRSPAAGTPSWSSTATPGPRRTGSGAGPG